MYRLDGRGSKTLASAFRECNPTDPITVLELENPSHAVPELPKISRSPFFEAQHF